MADYSVPVCANMFVQVFVCLQWLVRSEKQAATAGGPPASFVSVVLPIAFSVTTSTQV